MSSASPPLRKLIHIDMDAFYASVEQRDHPHLRGRPVVVGGSPEGRGVVAAASYEARRFGIHSAMPAKTAVRLCRELMFVRPDFHKYKAASQHLHEIFADYTDLIEPLSLDEAYLDVTENGAGLPSATAVATEIRRRVREELHLTCSAGVAPLKYVAKIASDFNKPDGLTVVPPGRVLAFVHPLPIRKLSGVGPATERQLTDRGIKTIGDLARVSERDLDRLFGKHGRFLWRLAQGDDPRGISTHRGRKSCSAEHTFAVDVCDRYELEGVISEQAERVCRTLVRGEMRGRTVTLKVRYDDFSTVSRSRTLPVPTSDALVISRTARTLLAETDAGLRPVRLIGVGVGNLQSPTDGPQLSLPFSVSTASPMGAVRRTMW